MGIQTPFPTKAGEYLTVPDVNNGDAVLCRLSFSGPSPPNAIKVKEGECLVAFSARCPHMGCTLLPSVGKSLPDDTTTSGLLRCPCHFSCFDLFARGLTVIGPATDWLAQMELRLVAGHPDQVELVGWIRHGDVGRGIPFGKTSTQAPEPLSASAVAANTSP